MRARTVRFVIQAAEGPKVRVTCEAVLAPVPKQAPKITTIPDKMHSVEKTHKSEVSPPLTNILTISPIIERKKHQV